MSIPLLNLLDGSPITMKLARADRGFKDGTASQSRFSDPAGIVLDSAGHPVIAETTNSLIREVDPALALNNHSKSAYTLSSAFASAG